MSTTTTLKDYAPITVMQAIDAAAKKAPAANALRSKDNGNWQSTSWKQYRQQIQQAAKGFIKLGLQPGKAVSIIGYNCAPWLISNNAAIYAGGVPAGIYTTNSPAQCRYIAEHSESNIAVVDDATQLAKFLEIRAELPELKAIVLMHGDSTEENVYSWKAFLELGQDTDLDERLAERVAAQTPDDVATLIYTSGTTGDPKAVMVTHDNLTWTAAVLIDSVAAGYEKEHANKFQLRLISYLPLSHVAEQIITIHTSIAACGETYFAESMDKIGENLRDARPTVFLAVPRVWEKIQAKMVAAGRKNSALKKKIAAWARKKGLAGGYALQQGKSMPAFYGLADKLVFSKVREKLGLDQCFLPVSSAAPIAKDTLEFFLSLGITIYESYGMSECSGPVTLSLPGPYHTTSVGPAFPGSEVKIAEDGEICLRGRHICKGYFKNESATAETFDAEGWLHSGDLGRMDDDILYITGRKKDLLITAGGENIAPRVLEELLAGIPGVAQAVVIGDKRKYLSALLTLDPEALKELANDIGSPAKDISSAATCAHFTGHVDTHLKNVNSQLARVQTIKKFVLLPNEFSIDGGELTPTMKIKRAIVNNMYSTQIESMY